MVEGAKARMAADPNFLFKLGVEVGMDEVITAGVNVAARGNPLTWTPDVALQVLCHVRARGACTCGRSRVSAGECARARAPGATGACSAPGVA